MSLSDCIKCWETPCECGWSWITYNPNYLKTISEMIDLVRRQNIIHSINGDYTEKYCEICGISVKYDDWTPYSR